MPKKRITKVVIRLAAVRKREHCLDSLSMQFLCSKLFMLKIDINYCEFNCQLWVSKLKTFLDCLTIRNYNKINYSYYSLLLSMFRSIINAYSYIYRTSFMLAFPWKLFSWQENFWFLIYSVINLNRLHWRT